MKNDELFARQNGLQHAALLNLAAAVRAHLDFHSPSDAPPGPAAPVLAELDRTMQSYFDSMQELSATVQAQNARVSGGLQLVRPN